MRSVWQRRRRGCLGGTGEGGFCVVAGAQHTGAGPGWRLYSGVSRHLWCLHAMPWLPGRSA